MLLLGGNLKALFIVDSRRKIKGSNTLLRKHCIRKSVRVPLP